MTLSIGTTARNGAVNGVVDLLDVGGAGSIEIRTGSAPATPGDAATGILLATLVLPAPAFGDAANGTANLGTVASVTAVSTGDAGYFRAKSGGGVAVFDGSVGTTGAELNLNSVTLTAGAAVSITSGAVSIPAS